MTSAKKGFALLLAVLLLCSGYVVGGVAEDEVFKEGDWSYVIEQDGTVGITKYSGSDTELVIPNSLGGVTVSALRANFLPEENAITKITIPASLDRYYKRAFSYSDHVTAYAVEDGNAYFEVHDGVLYKTHVSNGSYLLVRYPTARANTTYTVLPCDSIGNFAFNGGENLLEIVLPEGLTRIETYAFGYCTELASMTFPDSVTYLGGFAFRECAKIKTLTLPNNNQLEVEANAFYNCWLDTLNVSAYEGSFYNLPRASQAYVADASNEVYSTFNGMLLNKAQTLLYVCPQQKSGSVTLPESLLEINSFAFSHCNNITGIDIPATVNKIGSSAFIYCIGLSSLVIPESVTQIDRNIFDFCGKLSVTIPASVTTISGSQGYNVIPTILGSYHSEARAFARRNYYTFVALDGVPAITSITVLPPSGEICTGEQAQFTAVFEGTNLCEEEQKITWKVNKGLSIDDNGLLTTGSYPYGEIVVTATSVYDKSKSGSVTVHINRSITSCREVLKERIEWGAQRVQEGNWTAESLSAYQRTNERAQALYNNAGATRDQLLAVEEELRQAILGLTAAPNIKYIFSTKYESNFWNWFMFIVLFGWIWMWF